MITVTIGSVTVTMSQIEAIVLYKQLDRIVAPLLQEKEGPETEKEDPTYPESDDGMGPPMMDDSPLSYTPPA